MIKTKKNCRVCQVILSQPKKWEGRLAKRIYGARYYMHGSDYNLSDIAREYRDDFSYESLLNHCKKHQALSEVNYNDNQLRRVTNEVVKGQVKQAIASQEVWDTVISKGMERLANGEINLSATHLLAAARDKSNWEVKHADQQLEVMKMVAAFASEDGGKDAIEGQIVSGGTEAGNLSREERSRAFYQSLARDSSTPGTN